MNIEQRWDDGSVRARTQTWPRPRTLVIATADGVGLVLFVLVGTHSHHEDAALATFARNAVPLLASWYTFAAILGAYRRPGLATLVRTWLVAVPVALVVRTLWVGSPTGVRFLTFLGVGMAFTMLFLLMGRGAAMLLGGRGSLERPGAQ